jgi:endonuclease/exonuclease/phosphatase family metal-dependent hydrolase
MKYRQRLLSDTLLLATWNIRDFGNNRKAESLHYIAEIISRFDLVAIQEVQSDLSGLNKLMQLLYLNWYCFYTDTTDGGTGCYERMAILYDKSKIQFTRLVGELVLDIDSKKKTKIIQIEEFNLHVPLLLPLFRRVGLNSIWQLYIFFMEMQ